jgi:hypothetical protein
MVMEKRVFRTIRIFASQADVRSAGVLYVNTDLQAGWFTQCSGREASDWLGTTAVAVLSKAGDPPRERAPTSASAGAAEGATLLAGPLTKTSVILGCTSMHGLPINTVSGHSHGLSRR